jgi:hypothetical protein
MIIGILLLYIGIKFQFPFLYIFGCWVVIGLKAIKIGASVIDWAYKAGKDGK